MHFHRSLLLLAPLAWIGSSASQAQTPYLETASLSFNRSFVETGIISSTTAPVRAVPGTPGPISPDAVKPGDRVTTDIGAPIYYSVLGDQTDWIVQSQRVVLERIALQQKLRLRTLLADEIATVGDLRDEVADLESEIATTVDDDARELLQDELEQVQERLSLLIEYIGKQSEALFLSDPELYELKVLLKYAKDEFTDQGARWELTAVRAPQRTADAAARTPYSIFLSRIERTSRNPTRTFDTGLRLNQFFAVGSSIETLDSNGVTRATGNYTSHFEILMDNDLSDQTPATYVNFVFAADPLHLVAEASLALAEERADYNKNIVRTATFGSGYMTFNLRSTPGPLAAVVPTKIKITGHGSWLHRSETIDDDGITTIKNPRGGITPFAIKMGEVKFQSISLFPDFSGNSVN